MRINKSVLCLLIISLLFFVISCTSKIENEVIRIPSIPGIDDHSEVTIIPDISALNAFVSEDRMEDVSGSFISALEKYDSDSYFEKNYLIVILIEFDYALPEPYISDSDHANGLLVIYLGIENTKDASEVVTDWAILLEYPKSDVVNDVRLIFPI